jgi:SNF2 family DNA or RNA helicase
MPKLIRPKGIHYHAHQKAAIRWMMARESTDAMFLRGGILADEMGLGKTWTTIGLILNAPVDSTLLLVPPVLQPQWCDVLVKCGIAHTILGPPKTPRGGAYLTDVEGYRNDIHVTISTYDRAANNLAVLGLTAYDRIICDEGHILRNGSKTRKFNRLIAVEAPRRWIMSGTPVQNRKQDFRNLVTFLGMSVTTRLAIADGKLASELILRRTVGEVRNAVPSMPTIKPTHVIHAVTMPEGSEEESVFSTLIGRFEHALEINAKATIVLELYLRIRQFIAHPAIYVEAMKRKFKATYKRETWLGSASKSSAFERFLHTSESAPTIVFGTFRDELEIARITLERAGYNTWMIRGGMSDKHRVAATEESRAAVEAGERVAIVVQIVAGGAGLNLQHCNRVVFLSSHWNSAMVDQAIARAYRMGQTSHVSVHHLMLADDAEKNLDRKIAEMHATKRDIAIEIHSGLYCDTALDHDDVLLALDWRMCR